MHGGHQQSLRNFAHVARVRSWSVAVTTYNSIGDFLWTFVVCSKIPVEKRMVSSRRLFFRLVDVGNEVVY